MHPNSWFCRVLAVGDGYYWVLVASDRFSTGRGKGKGQRRPRGLRGTSWGYQHMTWLIQRTGYHTVQPLRSRARNKTKTTSSRIESPVMPLPATGSVVVTRYVMV